MIGIKTQKEIKLMAEGGTILAQMLEEIKQATKPGITTASLDALARKLITDRGVKPAFLGYGEFPAVICISVNDEVVHGVPSGRVLKQGDIVGLDFGIVHGGFYTDSAISIPVLGDMSYEDWKKEHPKVALLLEVTREALDLGIEQARVGKRVGEISYAVQNYVEQRGFGVVRDLVGHGIGKGLHEEPYVPNFGLKSDGPILKEGMTIAIEPMVTMGDWAVELAKDDITFKTVDGSLAAHFEHTIAITKDGPVVLTRL